VFALPTELQFRPCNPDTAVLSANANLKPFPYVPEIQPEPIDGIFTIDGIDLAWLLNLISGPIDTNCTTVGVDQPCEAGAIVDPLPHLGHYGFEPAGRRGQLDNELRAKRQEALLLLFGELSQTAFGHP
jgi:hypothetical protein